VSALQHLVLDVHRDLAILWLNRPEKLNACGAATHREMQGVLRWVEREGRSGLRALVIAGKGTSFCSGTDLVETRDMDMDQLRDYVELDASTKDMIAECRLPTVAWIHGYALGGGFELALACDFRAVTKDAVLGLPEVSIGTLPGAGGIQRLTSLVGAARASEIVLLDRRLTGRKAVEWGLAAFEVSQPPTPESARVVLADLLARDPDLTRMARAAIRPSSSLSRVERAYHGLAAASALRRRRSIESSRKGNREP
jgi:enoyl-CoA hydratase/carnithine racemase